MKKIVVASLILFSLIIVGFGYKQGILSRISHPQPVHVSRALYHNPDSLAHYAELAYLHEDPQGLYVTGAAAFLRDSDPDFPDSCTTVSLDEAAILLLRAAELGHEDALTLIRCLDANDRWGHSVPENK